MIKGNSTTTWHSDTTTSHSRIKIRIISVPDKYFLSLKKVEKDWEMSFSISFTFSSLFIFSGGKRTDDDVKTSRFKFTNILIYSTWKNRKKSF